MGLINEILSYNKETIDEKTIYSLKKYFEDPETKKDLEDVKSASEACYTLLCWVQAMYKFY